MGSWAGAVSAAGEGTLLSRHFQPPLGDGNVRHTYKISRGAAGRAAGSRRESSRWLGVPRRGAQHSWGFAHLPQTSPPCSCAPAEGGEGTTSIGCHRPLCPAATGSPPSSSPSSALVPARAIRQGEGTRGCCWNPLGTPPAAPVSSGGWDAGCPGRQRRAGLCQSCVDSSQLCSAPFRPSCRGSWGPQGVSTPLALHP